MTDPQLATARVKLGGVSSVVGFLVLVELTSGVLQGYYTPLLTDIARAMDVHDADVNWLEAAQLMVSAIAVPALAKLGDMVGHKRILLISTALTAAASLGLVAAQEFWVFLIAWALQGFYVVWLPLEVALIWKRSAGRPDAARLTSKAAGFLVAGLEFGVIVGALVAGALIGTMPLPLVLLVPALCVVACFFVILFGVRESPDLAGGRLDSVGVLLATLALLTLTGGLSLLRLLGPASAWPWLLIVIGIAIFIPFANWELRHPDPLVDVRMFRNPALWPIFLTAGLFGVSVLGAQAPLSTFARTDPDAVGYGLGATGFSVSLVIGCYVLALVVGALLYPPIARRTTPRLSLIGASLLVALGYLLFLPLHDGYGQVVLNMLIAGLGSGALVAALPAAAAAAAPATQTGVATGMTNTTKTIGGAIASSVFGIALLSVVTDTTGAATTAAPLSGYLTVWLLCGGTAILSAILLAFVPKLSFADRTDAAPELGATSTVR